MEERLEQQNESQEMNVKDVLNEIETIMLAELRFYSSMNIEDRKRQKNRLDITDRMCKSSSIILATENLKERRFMNRTERKSEDRKLVKVQSKN